MPMSDFTLFLLFKTNEIFGSNEFSELGSDFMIISEFFFIYCFFLRLKLLEDKAILCLANCIFSSTISMFLAILSSNFFQNTSSALFLLKTFFAVASIFFATVFTFLISLFCT